MRSLIFAAGIAAITIPLGAAQGAVFTLGGPLSRLCYQSALGQDGRASAVEGCTRALHEEALNPPRSRSDARQPRNPEDGRGERPRC
jgi:hypothetical protein